MNMAPADLRLELAELIRRDRAENGHLKAKRHVDIYRALQAIVAAPGSDRPLTCKFLTRYLKKLGDYTLTAEEAQEIRRDDFTKAENHNITRVPAKHRFNSGDLESALHEIQFRHGFRGALCKNPDGEVIFTGVVTLHLRGYWGFVQKGIAGQPFKDYAWMPRTICKTTEGEFIEMQRIGYVMPFQIHGSIQEATQLSFRKGEQIAASPQSHGADGALPGKRI